MCIAYSGLPTTRSSQQLADKVQGVGSAKPESTMSYPGAWVNDITKLLLNVLHLDMEIDSIVVHAGFNDIMKGSSEWLKLDFKGLIDSLLDINKIPIISVPVPSLNRGIECFNTIISLHNWLRDYCSSMGVTFVDNFDTFWKQNTFIRRPKSTRIVRVPGSFHSIKRMCWDNDSSMTQAQLPFPTLLC